MGISFETIPLTIRTPGVFVEFSNANALKGAEIQPHTSLCMGQMLAAGTGTDGQVYSVESADEAAVLFGTNSQLHEQVAAYKAADPLTELFAIGIADNGGGVAASGSITWTGTATESRELALYVGGRRISVAVTKGDTAATIETNALAAFALVSNLPVTVAADSGTGVDFTARHKGTIGNQIEIGHSQLPGERAPSGLTLTVTAMASGATDPDYTAAIAAMAEDQYNTIAVGIVNATPTGLLIAELESRWGPMRQIEGVAFGAFADTRANLTTLGNSFNSFSFVLAGLEVSALLPLPWEVAGVLAGRSAQQAETDPARASTGVTMAGMAGAKRGLRFTRAQRDILLSDGVSTFTVAQDGRLLIERLVTTFQVNALSLPDTSFQDLTTVRTLAALRFSMRARISSKFARFKLKDDGEPIPAGQPIVNPSIIKAELIALFLDWIALGWVEDLEQFKAELVVERDGTDPNRVNALLPPNLINNLLVTAAQIAFRR